MKFSHPAPVLRSEVSNLFHAGETPLPCRPSRPINWGQSDDVFIEAQVCHAAQKVHFGNHAIVRRKN